MSRCLAIVLFAMLSWAPSAWGHGSAMAVFKVVEDAPEVFSILWKVNRPAAAATFQSVGLPADCKMLMEPERSTFEGTTMTRSRAQCSASIGFGGVTFPADPAGLHVMVEGQFLDGSRFSEFLRDDLHVAIGRDREDTWATMAGRYFIVGVEHILLGIDHLLFVLGLMLIIVGGRKLVWAVTAFTIAHSITLALAVLDILTLKSEPVEACIALSIVLLAREAVLQKDTLSARLPWLVAFAFGLLHGLGFAGALREVGLPQDQVPLALLSFNVGVEAGQLLFVFMVWQLRKFARERNWAWGSKVRGCTVYAMGGVAVFWVMERTYAVLSLSS